MILIEADRDSLLKPLQAVSGIVERRHTLPILSNVLLECKKGKVRFVATDLEIQIATEAECGVKGNDAAVTTSARKLQEILRVLPEKTKVVLEQKENRMLVKAGKSHYSLQTLPAEDFPRLTQVSAQHKEKIPQKQLKRLFGLVQYAMAQQDVRYYLNGLLLVIEGDQIKVIATDGHRLGYASIKQKQKTTHQEVILPRKAVIEICRLLDDVDEEVIINVSPNQVIFTFSNIDLTTKVIDGKFPDYTRVIPSSHQKQIRISREILQQALQRIAILANEKFRGVRWVLTGGNLRLVCTNNEQEEAQEELDVDYKGETLDIGFNISYLLDVLNNLNCDQIECAFGDANSSALITIPGSGEFKYVVMPMRI
ncbi:MAG TPA: DNA polymerase III subunit beta [Burkholderiales bacterium]|nr:DNA polymerase III subunit beta [Burkholderiales bacterium]